MKNITLLAVLCILLTSCFDLEYKSEVPLSSNVYSIKSDFLGNWARCSAEGYCTYLDVTEKNGREYYFSYRTYDNDNNEQKTLRTAFLSYLNGDCYVNIEEEDGYAVAKIEVINDKLYLHQFDLFSFFNGDDEPVYFDSSERFRKHVQFIGNDEDLFLNPDVFTKGKL